MPKSTPPSRGNRRAAPTKVAKPFPWGTAVGSAVLAVALIGILVYAAMNQGGGVSDVLRNPDKGIKGVAVASDLAKIPRNHVAGTVKYAQTPPNGGDHNAAPQTCAVYTEPIAPEHAVHSLEHGAVWVTYSSKASKADIEALTAKVEGQQYRMLSPIPDQSNPIDLTAWGRRLSVTSADDKRVDQFLDAYSGGPQAPEPGSACTGTSETGPLKAAPATDSPSTTVTIPPAVPSAAPTK